MMTNLRTEIEPQIEIAEKHYSEILTIINNYEKYVDENGDDNDIEYKKIQNILHKITGKDMSQYSLYETSEAEGSEVLSFRIGLPDPIKIDDLTRNEVCEIVRRIKTPFFEDENYDQDGSFKSIFSPYLDDYYHTFLKCNLKKYKFTYFLRQKDGSELSISEIVDKII